MNILSLTKKWPSGVDVLNESALVVTNRRGSSESRWKEYVHKE